MKISESAEGKQVNGRRKVGRRETGVGRKRSRPILLSLRRERLYNVFRRLGFFKKRRRVSSSALTPHPSTAGVLSTPFPSTIPKLRPIRDDSIDNIYNYSSSKDCLLTNTLIVRQDDFPESQSSPKSSHPLDVPSVVICSVTTTQNTHTEEGSSQAEEFSTPPEEAGVSSSEERPPQLPDIACASPSNSNVQDMEEIIVASKADNRDLCEKNIDYNVGKKENSKLGFFSEMRRMMVELSSGGKVLVGDVCGVKFQLVGDDKSKNTTTPEKKSSAELVGEVVGSGVCTPNVPVEQLRLNSVEKVEKVSPLSIISPKIGKRDVVEAADVNGDRSSSFHQEKSEEGGREEKGEEAGREAPPSLYNDRGGLPFPVNCGDEILEDVVIIDSDLSEGTSDDARRDAPSDPILPDGNNSKQPEEVEEEGGGVGNQREIHSSQCKRALPSSFIAPCTRQDNGDRPVNMKKSVLEVLAVLARESRKGKVIDEDFDILETATKRGMEFRRPRWL